MDDRSEEVRMIPPRGAGVNGYRLSLALTLLRLALAPALVVLARAGAPGLVLAIALVAGFVSDVLDGVVARRAGVVTPFLRRLDSSVDTVFYLGVAYAAWHRHPDALRALAIPILIVVVGEALNYALAYAKFRREASYHARSAKLWGLLLFLALLLLLATGSSALLPVALAAGMLAEAETLAITVVLRGWRHDVPSVWNALRVRA
jgi:CDP-diacylglycerol--glycerol-3-phosphate 3-phosphatidyltransferase